MKDWQNKDVNALDYEGQQVFENSRGNGDINVDRNIQENFLRVVCNIQLNYCSQIHFDQISQNAGEGHIQELDVEDDVIQVC